MVMRHVLEHVHEPSTLFRMFAAEDVEYVHILVPNASSPFVQFFGNDWCSWDPPRHLQFFESSTLDAMALSAGYVLVDTTDHGIDEIVVSLFRRRMLQWRYSDHANVPLEKQWWFHLYSPKGMLCTVSAAMSSFLVKSVLSRLYRLRSPRAS